MSNEDSLTSSVQSRLNESDSRSLFEEKNDVKALRQQLLRKDADLELAAEIGNSLFEENQRLRNELDGMGDMASLKAENRALEKKLEHMKRHMEELEAQIEKQMDSAQEQEIHSPARSVNEEQASLASMAALLSPLPHQRESLSEDGQEMQILETSVETWKMRALAAERAGRNYKREEMKQIETMELLSSQVRDLETKLEKYLQKEKEQPGGKFVSQQERQMEDKLHCAESKVESLQEEIVELRSLLAAKQEESAKPCQRADSGPSLQAELLGIPVAPTKKQEEDETVDPYFFHFHMTAMSVKAHLSKAGSRREQTGSASSAAALDIINSMDTKEMYDEVLKQAIPPHHWVGYINDVFLKAQLQSITSKGRTRPSPVSTSRHDWIQTSPRHRGVATEKEESMFNRLLKAIAPTPPRQRSSRRRMQDPSPATASSEDTI